MRILLYQHVLLFPLTAEGQDGGRKEPLIFQWSNSEKHMTLLHICPTCMPRGNSAIKPLVI